MPNNEAQAHYQEHLDRVSRSFAVCIARLNEPLRSWTGLAYLLCRLLDTVEDAAYQDPAKRSAHIAELTSFIATAPSSSMVSQWAAQLPGGLVQAEADLVADAARLISDLHALPAGPKQAMKNSVGRMARGMHHYALRWQSHQELRLTDAVDVNRYCYFVAGVVGQLLSELFAFAWPGFTITPPVHRDAHHFGLLLQKVNLLKDQQEDEQQKRYLLADRGEVIKSLGTHGYAALDYITALPADAHAYRTFCAWSLFLGAASLPMVLGPADQAGARKIPRSATMQLFAQIDKISCDNEALRSQFDQAWALLDLPSDATPARGDKSARPKNSSGDWFQKLVGSALTDTMQLELGMAHA